MSANLEDFKDKKIAVTGCAGFIGSHLTDELLKLGANVIGIDNLYNGLINNLNNALKSPKFKFYQEDIRDGSFLIELFRDVDVIFHEAAFISVHLSTEMPEYCNDVNVNGTLNVLNAARINDVKRVIFASSAALYADDMELPKHEKMVTTPKTPYGVSKLAGETYSLAFYETYGLKTTSLRYFNVYGPRQRNTSYAGVIALFLEKVLRNGTDPTIFGDGKQTRDFIFVKDVVKANLMVAYNPNAIGEIFNVATGSPIDINSITKLILKYTKRPDLTVNYGPERLGDILHSYADISKIKIKIGFKPNYSINNGLLEYINYLTNKR